MKQALIKIAICLFSTILVNKSYSQKIETVQVTKSISQEDAQAIQRILNSMDKNKMALVANNANGKTVAYGNQKSRVVSGMKVKDIKTVNPTAIIHSTLTDFFFKPASKADRLKLAQMRSILNKYN